MRLYSGLAQPSIAIPPKEGAALSGFPFGNGRHKGCFTQDPSVRIHTCEIGMECPGLTPDRTVYITPIVTRSSDGAEIPELGALAGTGDLELAHEIDLSAPHVIHGLLEVCTKQLLDPVLSRDLLEVLTEAAQSGKKTLSIPSTGLPENLTDLSLGQVLEVLLEAAKIRKSSRQSEDAAVCSRKLPVPSNAEKRISSNA